MITVTADPADAVPEVSETDNEATGTVEIKDSRIINSQFG